jgi:hypothetical protein
MYVCADVSSVTVSSFATASQRRNEWNDSRSHWLDASHWSCLRGQKP